MEYDRWFNAEENRELLAICARTVIRNVGIGSIIWGIFNIVVGVIGMQENPINAGILVLGVLMLGMGVGALKSPSLGTLLTATVVSFLLLAWNVYITIYNYYLIGELDPSDIVFPLAITCWFAWYYLKLRHVAEQIRSIMPETLKSARQMCKDLLKRKLKNEPAIIRTTNGACTGLLMDDKVFFVQRSLVKAFNMPKDAFGKAIVDPKAKKLKLVIQHPLGKVTWRLDKRSSQKLTDWLSREAETVEDAVGTAEDGELV